MKEQFRGTISLLLCTMIWGSAFVAQSVGMDHIGPFTFQAVRSVLAVLSLLVVISLFDWRSKEPNASFKRWLDPKLWKVGIPCGIALFFASGLQQLGLIYTTPGKAGFITAMYIVIVPVLGLFLRQKVGIKTWFSVLLAVIGLYLLSCVEASSINIGDIYMLAAAFVFAVQIMMIDRWGQKLDGLRLNAVQFLVTAIISAAVMFAIETPTVAAIRSCSIPLLYTGIFSSAIAYSLQIIGQQHLSSDKAALIMSMESVFAMLAGWLVLHQTFSPTECLGACLVFAAVIFSQISIPHEHKKAPV